MGWREQRNAVCRIYRPVRKVDQAKLIREADFTDTTGADVHCRLMPDSQVELIMGGQAPGVVRATLDLPRGTDIDRGYAVVIYKLATLQGSRSKVSTTLASSAAIGDTTLTVSSIEGFEVGDLCVLTASGGTTHLFRVKAASTGLLTMYADHALEAAFAEDDTVEAKTLWMVDGSVRPQMVRGPISVTVQQSPGFWL